jgi:hypothetical protein
LVNGDFSAPPILGLGQIDVSLNQHKQIQPNPLGNNYANSVSGIVGWLSGTPESYGSDNGPLLTDAFGNPNGERMVFLENWNRMMSQTVTPTVTVGETAVAQIQFGTRGSDSDRGRAGTFYLVAGAADPSNPDVFKPGSIILDEVVVGNPSWNAANSSPQAQVLVGNNTLISLELTHEFTAGDPALGMPLTVAFRIATPSWGETDWDNASLTLSPAVPGVSDIPEPSIFGAAAGLALLGFGLVRRRSVR